MLAGRAWTELVYLVTFCSYLTQLSWDPKAITGNPNNVEDFQVHPSNQFLGKKKK